VAQLIRYRRIRVLIAKKAFLKRYIIKEVEEIILNDHNKQEYPPMHSAEHILNQTMVLMFGCDRSKSSHIEKKKSKCDYNLNQAPTPEQITEIELRVNEVIRQSLPISTAFVKREEVPASIDLSKLPEESSETLRLVSIGDYDICACIGQHVSNTSEIGTFRIISTDFADRKLRIRFKLCP
jgi:misacylated tRNA(Ala) deacylase